MTKPLHDQRPHRAWLVGLMAVTTALAACSAGEDELNDWIRAKKAEVKPKVSALEAPKRFDPQSYASMDLVPPFSPQKLAVAARQESARAPNPLLTAELNRRREPLESHPIDAMTMVGSLDKQGRTFALLRVDNLLYQVKTGDYIGQNYGRITKVTESEVTLREVVQDATGEWIERSSSLQLQNQTAALATGAAR